MSGLELLPVSGGAAVPVPPGETVLGRGPLLGISDKRVSRNHALLQNKDGRLRLKSTHVNPVFLQSGSDSAPRPLTRDQWAELQPGDTLSLLPGQFCYRLTGGEEPDQGPDQEPDQEHYLPTVAPSQTEHKPWIKVLRLPDGIPSIGKVREKKSVDELF
uniref:Zgc:165656 n=1 Tax=Neogobius melanostomus TaxID=47308 RepID=A0A8C6T5D5_9GOBI